MRGIYPLLAGFIPAGAAQKEVNSAVRIGVRIDDEMEFGDAAQIEPRGELMAEEVFRVIEHRERLLFLAAFDGYFDVGVAHIRGDVG